MVTDTTNHTIYRMSMTTGSYIKIPLIGNDNPIAIDYDSLNRVVYWTDVGSKQIRKANLDNRQVSTLRQLGSSEYNLDNRQVSTLRQLGSSEYNLDNRQVSTLRQLGSSEYNLDNRQVSTLRQLGSSEYNLDNKSLLSYN